MVTTHGLAASLRAAQESETFDLGGQNVATITKTIETAFQEPFVLDEDMIRLTFVTGAGKQSRQKYDASAAKAVTAALTKCGYKEDRGASCVMECGGTYKTQHDTGKNLFTVVVFPKVASLSANKDASDQVESLIPEDSPGYKIAVSSITVFRNMATAKCPSWAQKKACVGCIEALQEVLQELDDKLMNGVPLDASEQAYYDSCISLDEKETLIKEQAQELVEQGKITEYEKEILLQQNAARITLLEKKGKSTAKAVQRKELLDSIQPIEPRKLKYHTEIGKLHKELVPLLKLEAETKGRLLNLKETQLMARKDEILEEIEYLEEASRGWFEDDDVFASRVEACRKELSSQHGSRKTKGGKSSMTIDANTKVRVPANKWVTPAAQGYGGKGSGKKSRLKQGGSLFGAMMMDSSSDEESDDDDDDDQEETATSAEPSGDVVGDTPSGGPVPTKKKSASKKKSKKKKKKGGSASQPTEEETTASAPDGDTQVSIPAQFGAFLQAYLLPLLTAFLGWLVSLVFGKKKKKQ